MKTFEGYLELFREKLSNGENFAFTRFSDGELFILQNKRLELNENHYIIGNNLGMGRYNEEEQKKFHPETHSENRQMLIDSLQHQQENYFKGISCRCCVSQSDFDFQMEMAGGDSEYMTWSNLFVNGNYEKYLERIVPLFKTKKVIIVVNKSADISQLGFDIVKDFRVGTNCFINDVSIIDDLKKYISENDIRDHLVLVSAASLSNLIIHQLFREFPNNTYLDMGSTLNPIMKMEGWKGSREYLKEYWMKQGRFYLEKNCIW